MKPTTSNEIRQAFLDFYEEHQHQVVDSAPLPVRDNPTLFFTNAGMNQFVNVFLGHEKRPYTRATTAQKCMRVQGKHNDLENVGPSPRHHTFFEMLGNFSFGDYFKTDAIRYAYDFLTKACAIDVDKLWYTVHTSDDEAEKIWIEDVGVAAERVLRMGDATNFWMMGDVGPCGPTSEIHYDWGPSACTCGQPDCGLLLDNGCDRWLEIWNLVFMQFNQDQDGTRTPLPQTGVDTGMGLERITSVVQQQPVNYHTDLFSPVMDRLQELLGDDDQARQEHETGYRVIADHGRAATFLVADGVMPGNVGGSYVLRMIIRRAARFGRKIGFTGPFMGAVAETFIDHMGEAYPELENRREHVIHTLTQEEKRFARTLDTALAQLATILENLKKVGETEIPGGVAFDLYATNGLPLEITRDVAQEIGFTVDEAGYLAARAAHAEASGSGAFGQYETGTNAYADWMTKAVQAGQLTAEGVDYDPYGGPFLEAEIIGLFIEGQPVETVPADTDADVVTAASPFYVESGGEVSDTGKITIEATGCTFTVNDTRKPIPGLIVHHGKVTQGELKLGQTAQLQVDDTRRAAIRRNHTATHILHRELRAHLGTHVTQAGSLVAPDRLRFDFSYEQAVDKQTLAQIEADINAAIMANYPVAIQYMSQKEAISAGAMALFGEKYGDIVRTVQIATSQQNKLYSFELCGGLHVETTGDIGLFHFTSEGAVAAGVRRVEAVTGTAAYEILSAQASLLNQLSQMLNTPVNDLPVRLDSLLEDNRQLKKELARLQIKQAKSQFDSLLDQVQDVDGIKLLTAQVDVPGADELREMADWFRNEAGSGVAVIATIAKDRPLFVAAVTADLIKQGIKAGDLVRAVAQVVGGGGGGRPDFAQAGGKDASKVGDALAIVPDLIRSAKS